MRIAIVVDGSVWGGVEGYAVELTARLRRRGHDSRLVALSPEPVQRLLNAGATRSSRRELAFGLHPDGDRGCDVVHVVLAYETQFLTALTTRALLGHPFVLSEQLTSDTMFRASGVAGRFKKAVARQMKLLTYASARGVVAPSAASRRTLIDTHKLVTRAAIVAYNPCDCSGQVAARPRVSAAGSVTRFVTVARLVPQKGIDVLVEACYLLAASGVSFEVRIVGDGPERAALERQVVARGLHNSVRFLGQSTDVASHLEQGDVFVLPSRYEGLPFTILEAMCAGLPVVSTRVSGIPEAVGDDAGLLVPPEDPVELARAMEQLCRAPATRDAMALAGGARVRSVFSWTEHLSAVERLYEGKNG